MKCDNCERTLLEGEECYLVGETQVITTSGETVTFKTVPQVECIDCYEDDGDEYRD